MMVDGRGLDGRRWPERARLRLGPAPPPPARPRVGIVDRCGKYGFIGPSLFGDIHRRYHSTTRTRPRGGRARHAQRERDATDGTGGTEPQCLPGLLPYTEMLGAFSSLPAARCDGIDYHVAFETSEERTYAYERRHIECDSRTSDVHALDAAELPALVAVRSARRW